jgi:Trk-type K+ transport system membrane component
MTSTSGSRPDAAGMAQGALSLQRKRFLPVPLRLVAALAALIGIGTGLLLLPWSTTQRISFMDALFTATSASAVTGLTVMTTSTSFTRLGQWVILLLMELGGLGFLVVTVLTLRLLGRRISLVDRLLAGVGQPKGHPAGSGAHGGLYAGGRGDRDADPLGALGPQRHGAG